jgi:hypothetical protein
MRNALIYISFVQASLIVYSNITELYYSQSGRLRERGTSPTSPESRWSTAEDQAKDAKPAGTVGLR